MLGLMRPIVLSKHWLYLCLAALAQSAGPGTQGRYREHGTVWLDAELLRQGSVQIWGQASVILFPQHQPAVILPDASPQPSGDGFPPAAVPDQCQEPTR